MAKEKKSRKWWILAAVVLAAGGIGSYSFLARKEQPIVVQTERVTHRNLTEEVVAPGKIQPVIQVKISPEVSGEIIELPVKEGQVVKKGDLLLKIKPDFYAANKASAEANYQSSLAGKSSASATLKKAEEELKRQQGLFESKLISDSQFLEAQTAFEVAKAQLESMAHQVDMARASLDRAKEELSKTTIYSPLSGTVSKLNSQLGERVVGTATMAGTEVMILADLNEMEARVDVGETDVVLIKVGQKAELEVDSFKAQKFHGVVTEIANSAKTANMGQQQEATKFEVKIRITEKEVFRPGMSVNARIATRRRENAISVPFPSVTMRLPAGSEPEKKRPAMFGNRAEADEVAPPDARKKPEAPSKMKEVVFVLEGNRVKMVPVVRGISDNDYTEIVEGLRDGQEVISGSYKAINRELQDGKIVRVDNHSASNH